jgi:nucleoside-diphosphate-sugar epimerase
MRVRCLLRAGTTAELASISGGAIEQFVIDYDEPRTLQRSAALDGADYVFHVGGVTKGVSQREFDAGNVLPTTRLLDALIARHPDGQLKRFVLVSSQAAAGPARSLDAPRDESQPGEPIEEYGRSKLEAERIVAAHGGTLPFTIVRPSAVYGPRDRDFLTIFKQARRGIGLYPASRGRYLSVIHVRDVGRTLGRRQRSNLFPDHRAGGLMARRLWRRGGGHRATDLRDQRPPSARRRRGTARRRARMAHRHADTPHATEGGVE